MSHLARGWAETAVPVLVPEQVGVPAVDRLPGWAGAVAPDQVLESALALAEAQELVGVLGLDLVPGPAVVLVLTPELGLAAARVLAWAEVPVLARVSLLPDVPAERPPGRSGWPPPMPHYLLGRLPEWAAPDDFSGRGAPASLVLLEPQQVQQV